MITQEAITAEINYRHERAQANAVVQQARKAARRNHPSLLRRLLTRPERPPTRHTTPALR
jgi:hypothetical protein